jgi:hypothetical protein
MNRDESYMLAHWHQHRSIHPNQLFTFPANGPAQQPECRLSQVVAFMDTRRTTRFKTFG